jgi:hypothetical protein
MDQIRELAFRTAVAAANITDMNILFFNSSLIAAGLPQIKNWTQPITVTASQNLVVYSISLPYLICAIIVSSLGVLAVATLHLGSLELSRTVSLNPLEIAKAFDAPIFANVKGVAEANAIARSIGGTKVQYALVDDNDGVVSDSTIQKDGEGAAEAKFVVQT